jgi:hypothetical protein
LKWGSDVTKGIGSLVGAAVLAACSANPPPESVSVPETPSRAEPVASAPVAAPAVRDVPAASAPSSEAPPAGSVGSPASKVSSTSWPPACHVPEELSHAFEAMNPGGDSHAWLVQAGARLLEPDVAERALTGVSQEILSALAHRRYEKLAAYAAPEGICMRVARGAECKMLGGKTLAGCAASRVRSEWPGAANGEEHPKYSCGEAFRNVFYTRDYLHAPARFNCFPEPGRGKNPSPIILSGPHFGYVEAFSQTDEGTRSLWLVFDGKPEAPELVEMIAESWVP